ncbi:MAG: HyaD/HybD family hydrogenase maturation endopeptidase [Hyphomicrobiaceae bacterium]|nr:HyaD/HybD family hydrogenase maturation endopeptidase [Hyphomicrobiaceae bacterium]
MDIGLGHAPGKVLVLGIGNVLWADEGFGVRAVEAFDAAYAVGEDVTLMDGGTRGMALLPFIQDCDTLIIFDAVDFDLAAGTVHVLAGADVPAFLGAKKMSLHQTGFQEVLALAELTGEAPANLVLIGVQPDLLDDYGGGLTRTVAARIPQAVEIAARILSGAGVALQARAEPEPVVAGPADGGRLGPSALERGRYEGERPSAEDACRIGDSRFLTMRGA